MRHIYECINNSTNIIRKKWPPQSNECVKSKPLLILAVQCVKVMVVLFVVALFIPKIHVLWITSKLLVQQDAWLLEIYLIITVLLFVSLRPMLRELNFNYYHVVLITIALMAFCYFGHYLLLLGYDLSRDEQMANFDATIFSQGRLVWPLSPDWQGYASALNLEFMLPVGQPTAWVSAYLPMHAALRALTGRIADTALTGPLLTAGSLLLIWNISKRVWPKDQEAPVVAILLLLGSGQFVITGMTAYAMPAHLFFNLLWLRLFLANRPLPDAFAVLVGFVATGLHQPLFHPLFVAPFLLIPMLERQWGRLVAFTIGYGIICLFWLSWPIYIHNLVAGAASVTPPAGTDYFSRLLQTFSVTLANPTLTAANLLRFCTWQHLFLLPLMAIGLRAVRKNRFAGVVVLSFFLPICVMAIILPFQGIGFGFRYLHGVLGNAVLIAVFGWEELAGLREELRAAVLRATAFSLLILIPIQAWMAHARYAPFAEANNKINKSGTDYFLIKAIDGPLTQDLVLNRPNLSNRPIRLGAEGIDDLPALARRICRPGVSIALGDDAFYAPTWKYFDSKVERLASINIPNPIKTFKQAGCNTRIVH